MYTNDDDACLFVCKHIWSEIVTLMLFFLLILRNMLNVCETTTKDICNAKCVYFFTRIIA